jgi:hypothetical protein
MKKEECRRQNGSRNNGTLEYHRSTAVGRSRQLEGQRDKGTKWQTHVTLCIVFALCLGFGAATKLTEGEGSSPIPEGDNHVACNIHARFDHHLEGSFDDALRFPAGLVFLDGNTGLFFHLP